MRMVILLADSHRVLTTLRSLLAIEYTYVVRQTEMHISEPLVPESSLDVEILVA
jgi:hypothetical protein